MTLSRFNLGSTSKTLNLSLLRFNERFGSENLALMFFSYLLWDNLSQFKHDMARNHWGGPGKVKLERVDSLSFVRIDPPNSWKSFSIKNLYIWWPIIILYYINFARKKTNIWSTFRAKLWYNFLGVTLHSPIEFNQIVYQK